MTSLREQALLAYDDHLNATSDRIGEGLRVRLYKLFDLDPRTITVDRHTDPDGDVWTYALVNDPKGDMQFTLPAGDGPTNPLALTLLRICECGYIVAVGHVTDEVSLGQALEHPLIARSICPHTDDLDGEPVLIGSASLYRNLENNQPNISLVINPGDLDMLAQLAPDTRYEFALYVVTD